MRELKFVHQHCTFHLLKRIWNKIFENIDDELAIYKSELKNSNKKLSDSKNNRINKNT